MTDRSQGERMWRQVDCSLAVWTRYVFFFCWRWSHGHNPPQMGEEVVIMVPSAEAVALTGSPLQPPCLPPGLPHAQALQDFAILPVDIPQYSFQAHQSSNQRSQDAALIQAFRDCR